MPSITCLIVSFLESGLAFGSNSQAWPSALIVKPDSRRDTHVRNGGSFLACLRLERLLALPIRFETLPTCAWARGSSHTAKHQSEPDQVRLFSNK
jgi:hypothetical protein